MNHKNQQQVEKYVIDTYNNEPSSYKRVANDLSKTHSKEEIIAEMVRRRYSHLGIPEVIALTKIVLEGL